jgi:L-asparaginase
VKGRALVYVLFTGGTISMRRDPVTGAALPALSGCEIVARVPGLRREARLRLEDFARLPGPHVTPAWMWRLQRRVERVLSTRGGRVVVTHGTDTSRRPPSFST